MARLVLETGTVHPVAVAIVWFIGFVWMSGRIASGSNADADRLVAVWLGTLTVQVALAAGVVALMFN